MNEEIKVWAKSLKRKDGEPITLQEHTENVENAFNDLSKKLNDRPYLVDLIKIAIRYHDLGKVCPTFQIKSLRNKNYKPFDLSNNIYHSLFSVLWLDKEKLKKKIEEIKKEESEDYLQFVLSAIAYHHWKEGFEDLMRFGGNAFERMKEFLERKTNGKSNKELLIENLKHEGFTEIDDIDIKMLEGLSNGAAFASYVIPPYQLYWLPRRIKTTMEKEKDWILLSGFLMRSDHFASFKETEKEECKIETDGINPNEILQNIVTEIRKKNNSFNENDKGFWQKKTIAEKGTDNTILIAPTGSGKTEYSFLWSNGEKFFYTLPIRSAVNQIFERAKRIFGKEKAGLIHSDADVYLYNEGDEANSFQLYDLSRQLSYPAMISTGDQFFPYALRPPGYEKIFATFYKSRLVIDEVQAYDPKAAAIIVKFIEAVVRMDGKFLLMTATLPAFIKEAIKERIEKLGVPWKEPINLYDDNKYKELKKHRIKIIRIYNQITDGKPNYNFDEEIFKKVIVEAKKGQRVLIILNTVKQAQYVFAELKKLCAKDVELNNNLWLFHSRFTLENRKEKENKICGSKEENIKGEFENPKPEEEKTPKILVATQVVEASLDIDADVLFTELAPMDSLTQRMGRVLRRKKENYLHQGDSNVFVFVFKEGYESSNSHVYNKELLGITHALLSSIDQNGINKDELKNKASSKFGYIKNKFVDKTFPISEIEKPKKKKKKEEIVLQNTTTSTGSFVISEYEKFLVVELLFELLREDGDYKKKFYDTLQLLNAGYMSDRKADAQKMFRKISSLSIIAALNKDKFAEEVNSFLSKYDINKEGLYTLFKREVLSKFVLSVPAYTQNEKRDYRDSLEFWLETNDEIAYEWKNKMKYWLKGLYFGEYEYDNDYGSKPKEKTETKDDQFL